MGRAFWIRRGTGGQTQASKKGADWRWVLVFGLLVLAIILDVFEEIWHQTLWPF